MLEMVTYLSSIDVADRHLAVQLKLIFTTVEGLYPETAQVGR